MAQAVICECSGIQIFALGFITGAAAYVVSASLGFILFGIFRGFHRLFQRKSFFTDIN